MLCKISQSFNGNKDRAGKLIKLCLFGIKILKFQIGKFPNLLVEKQIIQCRIYSYNFLFIYFRDNSPKT